MGKDAFWFKHDSNASRDMRMMQIKAIHGMAGIGIFWSVIEILREQNQHRWENTEGSIQILSKMIDCDLPKLNNFLTDCKRIGLLTFNATHLTSDRLCRDMVVWETKKNNRKTKKKTEIERNDNESSTEQEHKKRREENKEDINTFNDFRILYAGTKRGIDTEFSNFVKKIEDWAEVLPKLKPALEKQISHREWLLQNNKFIPEWKNLQTWINQRCWEEVVSNGHEVRKPSSTSHSVNQRTDL